MGVTLRELFQMAGTVVAVDRGVEAVARRVGADAEVRFTCVGGGEAVVRVLDGARLGQAGCVQGRLPALAYCPLDLDQEEGSRHEVRTLAGVMVTSDSMSTDAAYA